MAGYRDKETERARLRLGHAFANTIIFGYAIMRVQILIDYINC